MHRSRIGLVLIDHPEDRWGEALGFWAGVQGVTPVSEDSSMPEYRSLGTVGDIALESQRTGAGTPPRLHLDIESDDVGAEVARVVALGARLVEARGCPGGRRAAVAVGGGGGATRPCPPPPVSSSAWSLCRPARTSSARRS